MALVKENDNKIKEFFNIIIELTSIRLTIGFIIFSFFSVSFFGLFIPSIKYLLNNYFLLYLNNKNSIRMFIIEGIILGIIFSFLLNIIILKKYYLSYIYNIILGCITGIICSIINFASGLISIFEIIINKKIYIEKVSPIGYFLNYWDVYDNLKRINDLLFNYILLTILIIFMNLIISVFIGIIVGLLHSMVEKKSKLELENSITNNNVQKRFSFYEIFIQYIIPNILKLSFVSGLIGTIYGILASVIMSKMI